MACRYYDDILVEKLQKWLPSNTPIRVLGPNETNRFFKIHADDVNDSVFKLPMITLSRNKSIRLLSTIKNPKSFDGLTYTKKAVPNSDMTGYKGKDFENALKNIPEKLYKFNVIPISIQYQLDIFTKTVEESEEYIRAFLFKLINNPSVKIIIPYNDLNIEHIANIRVLEEVSDTGDNAGKLFPDQFQRWTIQFELHDAFLFSIPYKKTWKFVFDEDESESANGESGLELTKDLSYIEEFEPVKLK